MNAVIIYHSNYEKYPSKWVEDFVYSISHQVGADYDVIELDYSGRGKSIYPGSHFFTHTIKELDLGRHNGHSEAHNWCCRKAVALGYDYVFNTNIDDLYHTERIARQLPKLIEGYDVVSCNMTQINEDDFIIQKDILFSEKDIYKHAEKGHNIIAHPGCAYSKNFIQNSGLLKQSEVPKDDFELWKRSFKKFRFTIVPYTLLYYRIHSENVSKRI